jgi:glutamyl-tRNA synthetase
MKLRFAPSPTGYLHVGGARTAIFNLLHARRNGGTMLLRIEDTDVERSRQHHAEQIVASLRWLGVEWDEDPIFQSDRLDRYRQRAGELVAKGAAYRCFCTVEDLETERALAEASGRQYRYSGKCRVAAEAGLPGGLGAHIIRFKVPPEPIAFRDLIRGEVQFDGSIIDDFVILRSDGYPTYHLSVVVDDIDMEITLVARGDDHLSNTPKHILLFRAFDAAVPDFAHLPLILGSDKKRLSKRTGATSAEEYRDLGILPEALFNFLLLLGWSPGGDRELLSRQEAIASFDLSEVHKAPAVFDPEKLLWMNGQYLSRMEPATIAPHLEPFLSIPILDRERFDAVVRLFQTRTRTLKDLAEMITPYIAADEALEYEEEAVRKHLGTPGATQRLREAREALAAADPFDLATTERSIRERAAQGGVDAGRLIHPLRVALTGKASSPPIFDVAVVLGRDAALRRIDRLISHLETPQRF